MIRFVEIGSDEKPKKGAGPAEAKAAPSAERVAANPEAPKPTKKPSRLAKAGKR